MAKTDDARMLNHKLATIVLIQDSGFSGTNFIVTGSKLKSRMIP
ncbi:hypothetical protein [Pontibacter burrus]|nr:hypothetical protein [Pontibacter burrus]